jgi:hypothetical protein
MENVELTQAELAYIMDLSAAESKAIFLRIADEEKIKRDHVLKVSELIGEFKKVRSADQRYDGENELLFNL